MNMVVDYAGFINIAQLSKLSPTIFGYLEHYCKELKWVKKYYILYQNLFFEFETNQCDKPSMVIPVEHCTAQRMMMSNKDVENQKIFYLCNCETVLHVTDTNHAYRAKDVIECTNWIKLINESSYSQLKSMKEELEYRNIHLLRAVNTERSSKWHLQEFTEEQKRQLDALRKEIPLMISKKVDEALNAHGKAETEELKKIKKIQSFVRGVSCRRRWHAIVQDYIRSPHAESMRARNRIVFQLVRSEEEYLECLSILVSSFYRPCKMAASSNHKLITHEEVNSIFLNSETLMFLHQIFLNGLQARLESWPKVILGDLFDMLLPMLSIYQEYVRNHHYSLQTLTECKQLAAFQKLLQVLEERPGINGRTLENFLTYPMHRIPTYISTLQKLLSLTPFDHVERKSLEHSQSVLEELSTVIHDEVSETESIRKNLAIERLFTAGCEFLLDSNEVFIRQGVLLKLNRAEMYKLTRKKSTERKEQIQQCFLFSRFLLITTRVSGGKLMLIPKGKVKLANATLIEDIVDEDIGLVSVPSNNSSNLAFKLIVSEDEDHKIILMAATKDEKAAWTSDISQCIENLKGPHEEEAVSFESRRSLLSIRSDTNLFKDADDIKYSRALDSTRLPKIQHATVQRLLERLLDVRFMTVEFLNTFLTTHTIFTTSQVVLDTIIEFYHARKTTQQPQITEEINTRNEKKKWGSSPDIIGSNEDMTCDNLSTSTDTPRKHIPSTKSNSTLQLPQFSQYRRHSSPPKLAEGIAAFNVEHGNCNADAMDKLPSPTNFGSYLPEYKNLSRLRKSEYDPKITIGNVDQKKTFFLRSPPKNRKEMKESKNMKTCQKKHDTEPLTPGCKISEEFLSKKTSKNLSRVSLSNTQKFKFDKEECYDSSLNFRDEFGRSPKSPLKTPPTPGVVITSCKTMERRSSINKAAVAFAIATAGATVSGLTSPNSPSRSKFNYKFTNDDYDGNIVTRRALKILKHWASKQPETFKLDKAFKETVKSFLHKVIEANDTVPADVKVAKAILRSLAQDADLVILTVSKRMKIILAIGSKDLHDWVGVADVYSVNEQFSTLHVAEQMTLIDYTLMVQVPTREFLSTVWMREDKEKRAPNLLKAIERFNLTSRLIASEIVSKPTSTGRANVIEKWAMVADACRCLHNLSAVLTIMTAFTSSAIFRLKKTWEKVSKQIQMLIEKLKSIVSTEGRFRNMREALKCCDPPCVPYLGFYLTDLAFIEETTSMVKDTNLVNFSKMKMVANIIHEIKIYQLTPYKIEKRQEICDYLLQKADGMKSDEQIYQESLMLEQKRTGVSGSRLRFSFHFGHKLEVGEK